MPTYEYECSSCDNSFEAFQSITAKAIGKCPECGARVRRLIGSGGGILFKGSGFYSTDYRSKEYKDKEQKEKASATSSNDGGGSAKKGAKDKRK